jgi:glutamate formiminotransferase/formiminotetrahydrofolate cyclodeaminase
MPKGSDSEQAARRGALDRARRQAIETPLQAMRAAAQSFALLEAMASIGNPASVSDAGVGALCARAAVRGAWLNVRINLTGLADAAFAKEAKEEGERLIEFAELREAAVLEIVEGKIG